MELLNYLLSLSDAIIVIALGIADGWILGYIKEHLQ